MGPRITTGHVMVKQTGSALRLTHIPVRQGWRSDGLSVGSSDDLKVMTWSVSAVRWVSSRRRRPPALPALAAHFGRGPVIQQVDKGSGISVGQI